MSISLLVNDTLWADNVGQDCTSHPVTISPMQKIFISDRGDVAIAVIGEALKSENKEEFIKYTMRRIHDFAEKNNADFPRHSRFMSRSAILITSDEAYHVDCASVCDIQGEVCAWGDNRISVLTALKMGKRPEEAIKIAIEICYGSAINLPIDSVKQSDLKAIDLDYYLQKEEVA